MSDSGSPSLERVKEDATALAAKICALLDLQPNGTTAIAITLVARTIIARAELEADKGRLAMESILSGIRGLSEPMIDVLETDPKRKEELRKAASPTIN